MDEAVKRAMARWPNVPDVYGWLSLDRRGDWRIKGERITNEALRAFISRNYLGTQSGAWAFQNGPQRVFVALDYTPWVLAFDGAGVLRFHTGAAVEAIDAAFMDEDGCLLLETPAGIGLLDDRDLDAVSETLAGAGGEALDDDERERRVEDLLLDRPAELALPFGERWLALSLVAADGVPGRFGFVREPAAPATR